MIVAHALLARTLAILGLLALSLLSATPAAAQSSDLEQQIALWESTLDEIEGTLAAGDLAEERFLEVRETLLGIIEQARGSVQALAGTSAITQQMIDALGPAPAEGEPAEAAVIATERARLAASLSALNAQSRQAELAATRADILLRTANAQRMAIFTETLFRRGASPLLPETWAELPAQIGYLKDLLLEAKADVRPDKLSWEWRIGLLVSALVAFGLGLWLRRWLRRRYGFGQALADPSYAQRVIAAVTEAVVRGLLPALATLIVLVAFRETVVDYAYAGTLRRVADALAGGLVFFFFFAGLGRAICAPDHPKWRVAEIEQAAARPLTRRLMLLAGTLGAVGAVVMILDDILVPPEIYAVVFFGLVLVAALALLLLLQGKLWKRAGSPAGLAEPVAAETPPPAGSVPFSDGTAGPEGEAPTRKGAWPRLRFLAFVVAVGCVAASALGYHTLARYVGQLFFAGVAAAGAVLLLRGMLREAVEYFVTARAGRVANWRRTLFPRERGLRFFQYVLLFFLDLLLFFLWAVLLLPVTGIAWGDMRSWLVTAAEGFSIGGFVLKPTDIFLAILAFVLALTVTRFIQRRLNDGVLTKLQMDRGVQNSITTGIGYVGVIIAIVIGVATLGLDLSNLALIAGALSVGIGFGLQNVVSNFVAGLILLVERPIKVGDWVVVGQHQGTVKRISVRATEIQTFQRASVIVPNADLVSTAVVNWTYKDKLARVDVAIGVDYGTDLKKLREVLLECAAKTENVLRYPAPVVAFLNFGGSSLDFELRVFIADTDSFLQVSNDLRFAIAERLEEVGIGIPFPQQVVHFAQIEELKAALAGRGGGGSGAAPTAPARGRAPP